MHQEFLEIHFYSIVPTIFAAIIWFIVTWFAIFFAALFMYRFFFCFRIWKSRKKDFSNYRQFFIQYFNRCILNEKYYRKTFIELEWKRSIWVVLFYWRFNKLKTFDTNTKHKETRTIENLSVNASWKSFSLTLSLRRWVCDTIKLSNRISCDNHMVELKNKQLVHIEIYI